MVWQRTYDRLKRDFRRIRALNRRLLKQREAQRQEVVRLERHNSVLAAQLEWMRMQLNKLEMERAILTKKVSGVDLPVPELLPNMPTMPETLLSFEDMGDELADRLGVTRNPLGEVEYAK